MKPRYQSLISALVNFVLEQRNSKSSLGSFLLDDLFPIFYLSEKERNSPIT